MNNGTLSTADSIILPHAQLARTKLFRAIRSMRRKSRVHYIASITARVWTGDQILESCYVDPIHTFISFTLAN